MLEIRNLTKTYADGTTAVKDVSIEIPPGNLFAILGTSGAGKTTLLQCLGRFLEPTAGSIHLHGKDIREIPLKEFRHHLGIVFQQLHLFPHLTVLENLTLAPRVVYGKAADAAGRDAREALERLGIANLAASYPSQISGGQAQRAAIARALVLEPEYVLLDEPTSALDVNTTRDFASWLVSLKERTTFIIVTHDLDFARAAATQAVLMEDGRVAARGKVEEVASEWTAARGADA